MAAPRVITTSVLRSVQKGESHGGVYLVDLGAERFEQVVDWARMDIDWAGRGLDRGLRGIAFHGGLTYIAASDEILAFDSGFRVVATFKNPYLRHCHEIDVDGDLLWATSTGFDSLLALDLRRQRFIRGLCLRYTPLERWARKLLPSILPELRPFDPGAAGGPEAGDTLHLNAVDARGGVLYCTGTGLRSLIRIADGRPSSYARIPPSTHNVRPYRRGVLMNHTQEDAVRYAARSGEILEEWPVVTYDDELLLHGDIPRDHARQGFARGLCTTADGGIVVGSSPATVSLYRRGDRRPVASINLTMDVRNAIHGLELYPHRAG